ncbi:MAG: hypothetical protein WAO35_23170 [Terriglobia bacterium]
MENRHIIRIGLGVFLAAITLLIAKAGVAEDEIAVFQPDCFPYRWRITLNNQPKGTLTLAVFGNVPGVKRSWVIRRRLEDTIFPAKARYCPEQGNCIEGEASVKYTQFSKKRAAGGYSIKFSNGLTEEGSFRVKKNFKGLLICE